MTVYSLTISVVLYSLAIPLLVFIFFTKIPAFDRAMAGDSPGKYSYLDPVRGIAALLVFIHHSIMVFNQHAYGKFDFFGVFNYKSELIKKFYFHFGQASVMMFFMITGFLFFTKLIYSDRPLNVVYFFRSRVMRLLPAMCSCFLLYIFACYILRDDSVNSSLINLFMAWFSFGFVELPRVSSSIPGWSLTAGVFWTLVVEWKFYILLPLLASIISGKRSAILFLLIAALTVTYLFKMHYFSSNEYLNKKGATVLLCFLTGLTIAILNKYYSIHYSKWIASPAVALCLVFIYSLTFSFTYDAYNFIVMTALGVILLAVISGNPFFGILKLKALHWAGKCSYSIYIMHALTMNVVFYFTINMGYYACFFMAAVTLCLLSLANYVFVERKYMRTPNKEAQAIAR